MTKTSGTRSPLDDKDSEKIGDDVDQHGKMTKVIFPLDSKDYKLFEKIGDSASGTFYRGKCLPNEAIVAIKIVNCFNHLVCANQDLENLIDHHNVLVPHCTFSDGNSKGWIVALALV